MNDNTMFLIGFALVGALIGWFVPNPERRAFKAQMKAFEQHSAAHQQYLNYLTSTVGFTKYPTDTDAGAP